MKPPIKLIAVLVLLMTSSVGAQNSYVPDVTNNRFVPPGATPEVKSWAPYDTSVRPQANSYPPGPSVNSITPDRVGGASPAPIMNPPIPYQFAPVYPSGPFLLR